MIKDKLVVVITLNYNQSKMTLECVDSILKSSYDNFKLLVVDNGSSIKEYKYLIDNCSKEVEVKRIDNNCGYVGGVNIGLEKAKEYKPDYYMIMNNDTIIDELAIQCLVEAGENHHANAIITGKVYHFDRPNIIQTTGSLFTDRRYLNERYPYRDNLDEGECNMEEERDMIDDIFWLIPEKLFNKVGYYSDNFFIYGEQGDYALRAVRKNFKLIFSPKAKIWHKGSITTGDGDRFSPPVNFWRHKGGLIYLYRNIDKKYFYLKLIKSFPKLFIKNTLNFLGVRNKTNKKSEYAAFVGYLYGLKWILNKKPDNGYNPFLK